MAINIYNKDLHLENNFVLLFELNDNKKMINHSKQSICGDVLYFNRKHVLAFVSLKCLDFEIYFLFSKIILNFMKKYHALAE